MTSLLKAFGLLDPLKDLTVPDKLLAPELEDVLGKGSLWARPSLSSLPKQRVKA